MHFMDFLEHSQSRRICYGYSKSPVENAMRKYRLSEEQRAFSYQEMALKKVCYYGKLSP